MRHGPIIVAAGCAGLGAAFLFAMHAGRVPMLWDTASASHWEVFDRYCLTCHNDSDWAGGVSFQRLDREDFHRNAPVWEAIVRKLRTGFMPPVGEPRPARNVLEETAGWLELQLDAAWAQSPNPGARPLARLNRAEYSNAIRDVLGYDASAIAGTLPPDGTLGGFDNIAQALSVSPTLLEAYATAAMQISRRAVGDRSMGHVEARYAAVGGEAQRRHLEGLPLGTRGGLVVEHSFPLDAEYEFAVAASIPAYGWQNATGQMIWCDGPALDITFNDVPLELSDSRRFRLRVPAGPHRIGVALVDDARCAGVNEFYLGEITLGGAVQELTVTGPFNATGAGDTPSRREIFVCEPTAAHEESPCAERILARLATRAYRYPAGAAEIEELMTFYQLGRAEGGDFDVGIQYALSRMLVDPRFLYRFEREPAELAVGDVYPVSDLELASRLSFFLWSSIPDDQLLELASAQRLSDPRTLVAQVERMLADPRANALVENFASQWLLLRELDEVVPQDPDFDADLRAAMRSETELLFADLLQERRDVLSLLDADYTWLNERLAAHYGVDGVRGSFMRRVTLALDSPRRGLLGHGSILTATSAPNRTSPVVRGAWLVENILGAHVPSPPPGAEADLSAEASESENLSGDTVRARLEMHRADPACEGCHGMMDPFGLALENFDLIGRWRDREDGHPIDASAVMVDGTFLAGAADLRAALLSRSDAFLTSMAERLMTYGLGRELEHYDQPAVRGVVRAAQAEGSTLHALVHAIVASDTFRMRVRTDEESLAPETVALHSVEAR